MMFDLYGFAKSGFLVNKFTKDDKLMNKRRKNLVISQYFLIQPHNLITLGHQTSNQKSLYYIKVL